MKRFFELFTFAALVAVGFILSGIDLDYLIFLKGYFFFHLVLLILNIFIIAFVGLVVHINGIEEQHRKHEASSYKQHRKNAAFKQREENKETVDD